MAVPRTNEVIRLNFGRSFFLVIKSFVYICVAEIVHILGRKHQSFSVRKPFRGMPEFCWKNSVPADSRVPNWLCSLEWKEGLPEQTRGFREWPWNDFADFFLARLWINNTTNPRSSIRLSDSHSLVFGPPSFFLLISPSQSWKSDQLENVHFDQHNRQKVSEVKV